MARRAKRFTLARKVGKTVTSAPVLAVLAGAGTAGAGYLTRQPVMMDVGGKIMAVGGAGVVAQQAVKHPKVMHLLHLDKKGKVKHVTSHRVVHKKKLKKMM
ncbi:MAG: hypothetical protein PVI03_01470 [Candidatus Thorarchaeota archaeon]|jgi:hypothetical protein